jgi:hypothetical protein
LQQDTIATHFLENQGQALSAGRIAAGHHNHSLSGEPRQPELQQGTTTTHFLENSQGQSHHQQARIAARHHCHSQTGEPKTDIINRLELQQGTIATHKLESQEQASSAG